MFYPNLNLTSSHLLLLGSPTNFHSSIAPRKEDFAINTETLAQTQAPLGQKVHDLHMNPGAPD